MGLTGFNLARRKQEEAATAASLPIATEPEATAPVEVVEKPKRKRRAPKPPAPVGEVAAVEVLEPDGDQE